MRKLFVILGMIGMLVLPRVILAETKDWTSDSGLSTTGVAAFGSTLTSGENSSLSYFIGNNVIKPVFGVIGVIFFALMVYAGVLWMMARGDSKTIEKAKDILTTAVIGTTIVVSSYVLTNALFNALIYSDVNGAT